MFTVYASNIEIIKITNLKIINIVGLVCNVNLLFWVGKKINYLLGNGCFNV